MAQAAVHVSLDERAAGPIAVVTVDNRRRLNCLSTGLILDLAAAFTSLARDERLRAVVLTGAGDRAFIGGADLNDFLQLDHDTRLARYELINRSLPRLYSLERPVIAAITGHAVGVGMSMAAMCDIRVASSEAPAYTPLPSWRGRTAMRFV